MDWSKIYFHVDIVLKISSGKIWIHELTSNHLEESVKIEGENVNFWWKNNFWWFDFPILSNITHVSWETNRTYGFRWLSNFQLDPTMGRRGTLGTPVPLVTNYVELADLPNATYHQHSLHFSPELDDVRTMRYLVYQLSEHLSDGKILCDGGNLFTWKSIGNEDEKKVMRATSKDGTEYVITITHVAARTTTDPQTVQVSPFLFAAL